MLKQIRSSVPFVLILFLGLAISGCGKHTSSDKLKSLAAKSNSSCPLIQLSSLDAALAASEEQAKSDGIVFRQCGNTVVADFKAADEMNIDDDVAHTDMQNIVNAYDPSVLISIGSTRAMLLQSAIAELNGDMMVI